MGGVRGGSHSSSLTTYAVPPKHSVDYTTPSHNIVVFSTGSAWFPTCFLTHTPHSAPGGPNLRPAGAGRGERAPRLGARSRARARPRLGTPEELRSAVCRSAAATAPADGEAQLQGMARLDEDAGPVGPSPGAGDAAPERDLGRSWGARSPG